MIALQFPEYGETVYRIDHPSGLPIFVWPKSGYHTTYAVISTRYGSIDTAFTDSEGNAVTVPAGIAHYLEHKLFENEDCDAMDRFARIGASCNAYTSFNNTAYLFTCTERAPEALEILLDFVQDPYFTEETVEKERGIIEQEIRMGEDSPSRRVLFEMLRALYKEHPIKVDIAGTVESIADITPDLLYTCYNTFYNLHNMVLSVCGDITPEQVLEVADRVLKPCADARPGLPLVDEPLAAVTPRVECVMPVSSPLFSLGYKEYFPPERRGKYRTPAALVASSILLDVLVGRGAPLYMRLMEEGLINDGFGGTCYDGPGYAVWMFSGESRDPDAVAAAIAAEIAETREKGIDPERFACARNALYGRMLFSLNDVEACAETLVEDVFAGRDPLAMISAAAAVTLEDVQALLRDSLQQEACALSILKRKDDTV